MLSYATLEIGKDGPSISSVTIDCKAIPTYLEWSVSTASRPDIPGNYNEPLHEHLSNGGPRDIRVLGGANDFGRLRKRLHDVLWRGSTPDNTIYAYVVKLLLAKIYDEKATNKDDRYNFQIFYTGSKREAPSVTFARVNLLYAAAYERYLDLDNATHAEPLNDREFSHEQVAFVVELLQDLSFTHAASGASDLLAGFFEGITRDGFKQSKGLFFTHMNIVAFLLRVLDLDGVVAEKLRSANLYSERLPYIIDPSCGSGTFLLAAMEQISKFVTKNRTKLGRNSDTRDFINAQFPPGHENLWAKDFIYGIDQTELLAMSTKVNMVLRRDGNTHVLKADGLSSLSGSVDPRLRGRPHEDSSIYSKSVAETFDMVVSNPPFSITLDPQTTRQLNSVFELAGNSNSENLFLERWYQLLRPKGRLGVVLPESFFATRENLNARLFLFAHFNVKAVISLPKSAFEPWTPTRTSLLFAEKKSIKEERAWKNIAVKYEEEASKIKTAARKAIKKMGRALIDLQVPNADPASQQVRAAKEAVAQALESLNDFFAYIRYDQKMLKTELDAKSVEVLYDVCDQLERRLDPRVTAFLRAAKQLEAPFQVASVENIGYRRTKRAETPRPNDLFTAVQTDTLARVFDLDLSAGAWEIVLDEETAPADLLRQLRNLKLWE